VPNKESVYPERMLENLSATRGLIFSGQLLLALTQAGAARETAYEWVQRNAMKVWDEGGDFHSLVSADKDVAAHLSKGQIDAVFSLGGQDDLLMVVRRVEALGKFLDTDDGKNLLAGTKRASNILSIEEKKDKRTFDGAPDTKLYKVDEEKALAKAIDQVKSEAGGAVAKEDFAAAMSAMAKLRPAVDAFFDKVKVNDDEPAVRENRLRLLNEIRTATRAVADFSKIEG